MTAPSFVRAVGSIFGFGTSPVSFNIDISGSSKLMFVGVITYKGSSPTYPTGITVGGVAMTRHTDADLPADNAMFADANGRMSIWRLVAPADGTGVTVTTTWSAAQDSHAIIGMLFNDVDQTTPIGDAKAQVWLDGNSNTSSTIAPVSTTNDLVIAMLGFYATGTKTPGAGQTARVTSDAGGAESLIASTIAGAAGTTTVSYTTPDMAQTLFGITIQGTSSATVGDVPSSHQRNLKSSANYRMSGHGDEVAKERHGLFAPEKRIHVVPALPVSMQRQQRTFAQHRR